MELDSPTSATRAAPAGDALEQSRPDILYIMGTGRSGTTILEILLANSAGISGVGELKHIFRDGFLRNFPCGCGRPGRQCELWSSVLRSTRWGEAEWKAMAQATTELESHGRFPLLWAGFDGKSMPLYQQASETLFDAVSAATQSRVIVDSSKYAGRALALARLFPDRARVLCITRSAAGIIAAFAKRNDEEQRPKGTLAAAAYYLYVLLCLRLVRARLADRCLAVRFEDLNRDPQGVLGKIETWSGYSLAASRAKLAAGDLFDVGHIVTGNRLRKKGRVRFAPQLESSTTLGIGARLIAGMLEAYRRVLGF
jgi:hypothetical protein